MPCSPPGDLPDPGIRPTSLMSPALAGSATWEAPGKVRILFSPAGAEKLLRALRAEAASGGKGTKGTGKEMGSSEGLA